MLLENLSPSNQDLFPAFRKQLLTTAFQIHQRVYGEKLLPSKDPTLAILQDWIATWRAQLCPAQTTLDGVQLTSCLEPQGVETITLQLPKHTFAGGDLSKPLESIDLFQLELRGDGTVRNERALHEKINLQGNPLAKHRAEVIHEIQRQILARQFPKMIYFTLGSEGDSPTEIYYALHRAVYELYDEGWIRDFWMVLTPQP